MQFCKIGQWVAFITLGQKHASKDEIELTVIKAFREFLIEVLSFGFGVAELVLAHLLAVLLVDGFSLVSHRDLRRTQASTQSRKINKGFIAELELGTIKI